MGVPLVGGAGGRRSSLCGLTGQSAAIGARVGGDAVWRGPLHSPPQVDQLMITRCDLVGASGRPADGMRTKRTLWHPLHPPLRETAQGRSGRDWYFCKIGRHMQIQAWGENSTYGRILQAGARAAASNWVRRS